ncbi:hypothetical protein MLD38_022815 [Melastoma candidum]|uniref:Uncharacterized protein n=1 Tax=Melastoma candidum TaxID=119954 RepID=A0ACB9QKI0_9MYRT|nr:hypothetical protein MLD38_022815 [Melastoma candidum]
MMRKPCCNKEETNKGAWSKHEDQKLTDYIRSHGEGRWRSLPKAAGLQRCGKSCRLRWINYLRPDIKRGNFAQDEEDLIIKLHALLGNRWSLIAGRLPGRTDNEVKNYWNSHIRKKLLTMGIDPNNHKLGSSVRRSNPTGSGSVKGETCSHSKSQCDDDTSHGRSAARTAGPTDDKSSVEEDETSGNDAGTSSHAGGDQLNLDLTIATPAQEGIEGKDKDRTDAEIMTEVEEEVQDGGHPTLPLFR